MARRSKDWNKGLAEDLQNLEFAREFLAAAVEDGVPLKLALGKVIRATGVKELAERIGMPSSNVLRVQVRGYQQSLAAASRHLQKTTQQGEAFPAPRRVQW